MALKAGEQAALIAAFREGLGLTGLALIRRAEGFHFDTVGPTGVGSFSAGDTAEVRFWCRHAEDAERVAAAANSKLRRQSRNIDARASPGRGPSPAPSGLPQADQALITAATRLHVALHAHEQITGEAMAAIARMEEELENLQRLGALKSVNRSYRLYRQEASARREKIVPYVKWLGKYKEKLVRQIAAALRYF